jgi:hypothetical protein
VRNEAVAKTVVPRVDARHDEDFAQLVRIVFGEDTGQQVVDAPETIVPDMGESHRRVWAQEGEMHVEVADTFVPEQVADYALAVRSDGRCRQCLLVPDQQRHFARKSDLVDLDRAAQARLQHRRGERVHRKGDAMLAMIGGVDEIELLPLKVERIGLDPPRNQFRGGLHVHRVRQLGVEA